jgi:hypothetical protein
LRGDLGNAIRSAGMIDARHHSTEAMPFDSGTHILVIGRDKNFRRAALRRALRNPHHHGLAGYIGQRLAGKPA